MFKQAKLRSVSLPATGAYFQSNCYLFDSCHGNDLGGLRLKWHTNSTSRPQDLQRELTEQHQCNLQGQNQGQR
jgi:hypothetical protein